MNLPRLFAIMTEHSFWLSLSNPLKSGCNNPMVFTNVKIFRRFKCNFSSGTGVAGSGCDYSESSWSCLPLSDSSTATPRPGRGLCWWSTPASDIDSTTFWFGHNLAFYLWVIFCKNFLALLLFVFISLSFEYVILSVIGWSKASWARSN